MLRAVVDTHALIWYLYDDPRLSTIARDVIEEAAGSDDQIGLSAISLAKIVYLNERGRIHVDALARIMAALDQPNAVLKEIPFDRTVAAAMADIDRKVVPDMPDRLIAATAQRYRVPLISRDHRIRLSGLPTIW